MSRLPHISVCICTYKRPDLLKRVLEALGRQETGGLFTFSVVVADNDKERSSELLVSSVGAGLSLSVTYCHEPQQSIACARNKAVANADGNLLAFIDDDEFPVKDWLLILYKTCLEYKVDGVLGLVLRHFDETPPKWLVRSDLYKRPVKPTGCAVHWTEARTGNVLLKRQLLADGEQPFRQEFRSGEDQDFFRRMIERGNTFIWCAEAVVYEVVPPARWRRSYILRKALLRGASARLQPTCNRWGITKSLIAVPAYVLALPAALILGQHRFMDLFVRLFDHLGKLLAVVGINPVKEPYVSDQG